MKKRLGLLMVLVLMVSLVFAGVSYAKGAKMTPEQAKELAAKFQAAYPEVKIADCMANCKAEKGCEKVQAKVLKMIKKWDALTVKSNNEKLSENKRANAKKAAEKVAEQVKTTISKHCEKCNVCGTKAEVPGEYQPKTEKGRQVMELLKGKK